MAGLTHFTIRGIRLSLPEGTFSGRLADALEAGRYENTEAAALLKHLRPGDRFVDFGAGIGFLCALAAGVVGAEHVTGVEAGETTIALARNTLDQNGFPVARLIHGAVVGTSRPGNVVEFGLRGNFWSSGLKKGETWLRGTEVLTVPAHAAGPLLADLAPTVLSCDIEGAELEVLAVELPASLRLIVTEIHPGSYGPEGTGRIFDALLRQGFVYEPDGSRGATVVFRRIGSA